MVLVYLTTKLGDFVQANVGKYSSTMEQTGNGIKQKYIRHLNMGYYIVMDYQWIFNGILDLVEFHVI